MKKLLFILFLASFSVLFQKSAHAQEFAAGVNPAVLQIESQAPASVKAPITLTNQSDQTITYSIFLRPFKANSDLNGDPNYDSNLVDEYKDFFTHVQLQDQGKDVTDVTLAPGQIKDLRLRISVDKEIPPKDYYFTVVFLANPGTNEAENSYVGTRGGIGTNVLLTVGPKAEPVGRIASFNVPRFVSGGPVVFSLELANHNDYFVTSNGNLVIKNIFGQIVGNLEFGPTNILANSNRLVGNNDNGNKLIWNEKMPIGIYKAEISVALSDRGPLLKQTKIFLAFPVYLVLGLIVVIALIAWLIRRARRRTYDEN